MLRSGSRQFASQLPIISSSGPDISPQRTLCDTTAPNVTMAPMEEIVTEVERILRQSCQRTLTVHQLRATAQGNGSGPMQADLGAHVAQAGEREVDRLADGRQP